MTSSTKAREWEMAVELMLSMASQMRWSAVGAPMVMSVNDMSLSMDPTRPTILRCPCRWTCSSVMRPVGGGEERGWVSKKGLVWGGSNGADRLHAVFRRAWATLI